ncbi:MAG: aminoglycoside phosphotransferase [Sphingobacteriia bacterium 24-36-13]|jgi:Ser/Thr protein kinase RdoA (MazF antagonist)|uniref:phosphotransferase enzyme family protein n=1 Tax=Sediminibacterium sp. TaxID=1917865 RepID=UPI000BD63175|nr:phosphotransferase [Sediminibacterium sp.]OYY09842.1 MAG: aminoglycoside phosphotransferase [Sphingobacteriia bacterium 35-36-14]OYZ53363.1 MAG: aminoglycoside phosphotransferase [Sphingobacteriia bacterium 24-36-13]HQS23107.1 phosphotransferase [Sediminibacterium sp.]HQS34031.1 phosphotransferase [Sediminibacterium sp.]
MITVLQAFGLSTDSVVEPITSGIINSTWKVKSPRGNYILQRINDHVFANPEDIHENIAAIALYLKKNYQHYLFPAPILSLEGSELVHILGKGYYRLFPFIAGTHTINVVENTKQAFEAAEQFGRFTAYLGGFDITKLKVTIPNFHDLSFRYNQFLDSIQKGNLIRVKEEQALIDRLVKFNYIVKQYEAITKNPAFKKRVTHHDTKISNVLFNEENNAVCIIDLDTLMPGYFISDVGDMMRTYLCPVSENEEDISKIIVRPSFYYAIVEGYYKEMKNELTAVEKNHFFYAAQFMIYMQAIRFLTDYFNDDKYYQVLYQNHNLVRAINQTVLLERLMDHEVEFKKVIL